MRIRIFATLMAMAACTTPPKEPVRPNTVTVKPGAPTELINSSFTEGSAHAELRFDGSGENVSVMASGLEGVTLTSAAEVVSGRTVKTGDTIAVDLTFTKPPGRGHLVLTVNGTFNGAVKSRVHTVLVGEGAFKDDGSKVQVTNDGDTVKLIP